MVDVSSGEKIVCRPMPRVRPHAKNKKDLRLQTISSRPYPSCPDLAYEYAVTPPSKNKKDLPLQTISSRHYPRVCSHAQTLHMSLRLFN
jgi:hypothetical protein